ncbi:hypothetical protein CIB84_016417 [Bambusicola thoracicus]|uniref:Uncharacterized protein n=1 Tax=Bambusicola thoracicus TaxID=9083 RepID=A0A2P4S6V6_BAMTH|nr:hypothetical protein CIB84_016417 [Bambusicola thoracicus]
MCLSPAPPMGGSVTTSLPHGGDAGDEHSTRTPQVQSWRPMGTGWRQW